MTYRVRDRGSRTEGRVRSRRARGLLLLAGLASAAACRDTGAEPAATFEVVAVEPADGAAAVSVTGAIVVTFSRPLDAATLEDALVLDDAGRAYQGELAQPTETTLAFTPGEPLDFGTLYRVTVNPTLRSRDGAGLPVARVSTFTTQGVAPPMADGDSMRQTIRVLADDSMLGRRAGSADELRAAQYLASRFEAWGLVPLMGGLVAPFGTGAVCGWSGSRNVLAVVPGSGVLAAEWVVVGGHYDAMGTELDATGAVLVRNGADDNASGTAMMLELARLYSRAVAAGGMAGVPRRSVLFAGFGAEERGLIGSCEFIQSAAVAPAQMAGMVNFDMVGRLRNNTVTVQVGGVAGGWDAMLANTNVAGLTVTPYTVCKACSDYYWFGQNGVPYVWFYTGDHPDYHRPTDDENLIDYGGMVAIGSMAYRILTRLAVAPGRPIA